VISQWASEVIGYSSQYTDSGWSAAQALGEPDTFSYGDNVTPTASAALIANDDVVLWTAKDTAVIFDPAELLGNDKSADNASLQITHLSATNGTLQLLPDGTYRFTPAAGFVGLAQLAYTVSNGMTTTDAVANLFVLQFRPAPGVRLPRDIYNEIVQQLGSIAQRIGANLVLQRIVNLEIQNAATPPDNPEAQGYVSTGRFSYPPNSLIEALRANDTITSQEESIRAYLRREGFNRVSFDREAEIGWHLSTRLNPQTGVTEATGRVRATVYIYTTVTATSEATREPVTVRRIPIYRATIEYEHANFAAQPIRLSR
jgi:hypothetical protein